MDNVYAGKNIHEYGLVRGQRSPYMHSVHTVCTFQKSAQVRGGTIVTSLTCTDLRRFVQCVCGVFARYEYGLN